MTFLSSLDAVRATNQPPVRSAWRGPSLLTVDTRGRCGTEPLTGFFFRETRCIRDLALHLEGEEPLGGSIAEAESHAVELSYLFPPVDDFGGGGSGSGGREERHGIPVRGLDLALRYEVFPASLRARLRVTNRTLGPVELTLAWTLSADFADIGSTQPRASAGPDVPVETRATAGGVVFRSAEPRLPLTVEVHGAEDHGWRWEEGRLRARVRLAPQESADLGIRVRVTDAADPIDEAGEERRLAHLAEELDAVATLFAPGETPLVELTRGALRDIAALALLDGPEDEWLAPAAGIPVYHAFFGRDMLTAGWQAAPWDQGRQLRDVLRVLARRQGTTTDPRRDEEPGRIVQQARRGPEPRLGLTPFDRYYGDFASPFMFVIALGHLYAWSGARDDVAVHWDTLRRIMDWAREHGDADGDGYQEYLTRSEHGPLHQGWKDSDDAVVREDGSQVAPPVAVCEVQGYWYAALQFMAAFALALGEKRTAWDYWKEASALKERFNRDFWLDDEGVVAFGLDAGKRPIRTATSNAGQCLATGIVDDDKVPRLVRRLFQPDLFSGWGIRTLSTQNPAYNPLSYHLGSIWPVENGTITFGLRRYGFDDRALELSRGLYDLARSWGGRTPECVGGYARDELAYPGSYPRANAPQTWNQSTLPLILQSILGLVPLAPFRTLAVDPVLPPWLPELTVRGLRVGEARVGLRFHRAEDGTSRHEVVEQEGTLHVVRQPPIDSLSAGLWDRLTALAEGVVRS
ncbi:MAG TPA: glycogen debranching N-terminal domain-containing protein [Longimicrobiaceae bacterium]|nr:glycogen debranching N-terminal domain-containing protein [Longimicrobiaceae bacterium]